MSDLAYETVREHLLHDGETSTGKGASDDEIRKLVALWGPLPQDFERYLREFGWASIQTHELYGLGEGIAEYANLLTRVPELWQGRTMYHLPEQLLPVFQGGGGWFYCLSKLHPNQPIVCWAYEYEELDEDQPYDFQYPSWSDWVKAHLLDPVDEPA